ncbi:Uncharacterized conserved protein UCP037214 [Ferroglobus placidus DSM 10642]|uniref:Uncharacterized conserved protein UCP037214 n=1 Tax=Ferroglobus placidus (strain DSM 10642 / AEDII12DO) TaxID=589924 RepID=D3S1F3_FERPA|nr:DUF2258 domain-containing protein [Ferroglobus placidus]ADC66417.1 Uncharacterized conserved protein UCP037214 [Ferroglobus placidus DSM 10642]
MKLSSGLVIAGAYADKVRRTLFAQLRDMIKREEIESKEVARAAAELNRLLYELFVNKLKLDKGDVVRVRVDYEVEEGVIKWNLETLEVEAFRRIPEEEVKSALSEVVSRAEEIAEAEVEYEVEEIGETDLGDMVYAIKLEGEEVGAVIATPINEESVVRGAVTKPVPVIIEKTKVQDIRGELNRLVKEGRNVESGEAEKVIEEIKSLLK